MTLSVGKQLRELRSALKECAKRCDGNLLLDGTWVQQSFSKAVDRLNVIERSIAPAKRRRAKP